MIAAVRDPTLRPFSRMDSDVMIGEIEVFHPQSHTLHQVESSAIE